MVGARSVSSQLGKSSAFRKYVAKTWERENLDANTSLGHFVGTSPSCYDAFLNFAGLGPKDVLFDVGCGSGVFFMEVVQRTGCKAVGLEVNPELCRQAEELCGKKGLALRTRVVCKNAEDLDSEFVLAHRVTVIYVFLIGLTKFPGFMDLLRKLIRRGIRVITHQFMLPREDFPAPTAEFPEPGSIEETMAILGRESQAKFYSYSKRGKPKDPYANDDRGIWDVAPLPRLSGALSVKPTGTGATMPSTAPASAPDPAPVAALAAAEEAEEAAAPAAAAEPAAPEEAEEPASSTGGLAALAEAMDAPAPPVAAEGEAAAPTAATGGGSSRCGTPPGTPRLGSNSWDFDALGELEGLQAPSPAPEASATAAVRDDAAPAEAGESASAEADKAAEEAEEASAQPADALPGHAEWAEAEAPAEPPKNSRAAFSNAARRVASMPARRRWWSDVAAAGEEQRGEENGSATAPAAAATPDAPAAVDSGAAALAAAEEAAHLAPAVEPGSAAAAAAPAGAAAEEVEAPAAAEPGPASGLSRAEDRGEEPAQAPEGSRCAARPRAATTLTERPRPPRWASALAASRRRAVSTTLTDNDELVEGAAPTSEEPEESGGPRAAAARPAEAEAVAPSGAQGARATGARAAAALAAAQDAEQVAAASAGPRELSTEDTGKRRPSSRQRSPPMLADRPPQRVFAAAGARRRASVPAAGCRGADEAWAGRKPGDVSAFERFRGTTGRRSPSRPARAPRPRPLPNLWRVVGGEKWGGILVKSARELDSEKLNERLSTGSTVQELFLDGDRLYYFRLTGTGPLKGWVTVSLEHKVLVERVPAEQPLELALDSIVW